MQLRDRLQSLGRRPTARAPTRDPDLQGLAAQPGGRVGENGAGAFLVCAEVYPLPPRTGAWDDAPPWLFGADSNPPEPTMCFFDTETTGPSGGGGNQVFLMAMAWRVAGGLLMREYLLR